MYHLSKEEQDYLKQYNIEKYERPSVATDMVIFSIMEDGKTDNFRKLQKKALKLLMVKRAEHPFKTMWALPGGFCRPDEDVCETAKRTLYEETNVKGAYLSLVGVFGDVGRDPRGWIVSNTYLALVDGNECEICPGNEVGETGWFSVSLQEVNMEKNVLEDTVRVETEYELSLICEEADVRLCAKIKEHKQFANYHESVRYEIVENEDIAFDHARFIVDGHRYYRRHRHHQYSDRHHLSGCRYDHR